MSDSLQSHGLWPIRLLCPWDFPGKSAGVDCRILLQGIFLTQGLNPGLPHCRQTLYFWATGKRVRQDCTLSPCLFNFHAEYIMRNPGLEETQAGIKIAGSNINHLRYADDTTLMAESEEELKSLLMKVKEESEKVGLKSNIQKTMFMASGPIAS